MEFSLEEDLFAKLIFLYRSPETMIKWTRPAEEQSDEDETSNDDDNNDDANNDDTTTDNNQKTLKKYSSPSKNKLKDLN